ncbi:hypothetical protein [Staphylococcus warneri]|uniref:hypothetical protein n=1 Tax=Staphylococcus warneri TaxID=1292 RepID=UPI001A8F1321|nr:hypothetical protein [Staphylococcus warneri]MBO0377080.1 hypothetical protein [Staphylococcus warneri]
MTDEELSYELEKQADEQFIHMIRLLAETVDKRCFKYGGLRYMDVPLLNKVLHLLMVYNDIKTLSQLAEAMNLSFTTLNRMMNHKQETTVHRKSIDKVLSYMYQTANEYEEKLKIKA